MAILAFPSDQFGGQELATDAAVADFAAQAAFPPPPLGYLLSKGDVNGPGARPAWVLLKALANGGAGAPDPTWNFNGKFLVAGDGAVSVPGDDLAASIRALL